MSVAQQMGRFFSTADSNAIGRAVEDANFQAIMRRRSFERRWYDNNFFDDGYHFRLVSKKTGRIIDTVNKSTGYVERAIPRASKQIRGVGNLLFSPEYYPVVYPERITEEMFRNKMNGQIDQQALQTEQEKAKESARKRGIWLTTEWEDELDLPLKLMDMIILAAKHSISYLQIYTDPLTNRIAADVYDAFDLIHYGDAKWLDDLPFITKATPWDFQEVVTSQMFDADKVSRLTPDNAYATSEIKNAYMRARYGSKANTQAQNTIIVRETFLKEYLGEDNWKQAVKLSEETGAMEGKSKGDCIMRHPFSAGGVTLHDEYVDYDNYPFADFRFEPGYLYQVPLIERFIPLNKSLDVVVTRLEKWINAMVVGVYMTRKGENMQLNNWPGGQQVSYEQTPPQQMQVTNAGQTPFAFAEMIDKYLEEQGTPTFTMNNLPQGVTANAAFESSQQREFANMKFATLMLRKTITRTAELMMERGDKDYIEPMEVAYKDDGKPSFFSVIGTKGHEISKKVKKSLPNDLVTLNRKAKIRIEIEQGLGFTAQGKKDAIKELMANLTQLYQMGFLSSSAMAMAVKRSLEVYGYGSTEEFMEEVENGVTQGVMNNTQIQQMQIAVVKALRDAQVAGPQAEKKLVDSTKLGVLQTLKDAGLIQQTEAEGKPGEAMGALVNLYKNAPPDVRRQIEQQMGLEPSQEEPVTLDQSKTAKELHSVVSGNHAMKITEQTTAHQMQLEKLEQEQDQQNKEQELALQQQQAEQSEGGQNGQSATTTG